MSSKTTSRPRKHRQKEEMKQEIVVQVHKTPKKEVSPDTENVNKPQEATTNGIVDSGSDTTNKIYKVEDRNDNYSIHTPSREVSVDGEAQISSKILSLIETEMKRDLNKHSHFTDSRPQSLSFYEEEKIPEELSGNLELLSPEERKYYKKRKEHAQMDTDERNAYNSIQDLYTHDDEIINSSSSKRSKTRKKRHGDNEHGLGDSREMMIPKEKRKSKKKKRETSPGNGKKKHRRRDDEQEVKGEIALALDELQDDVFETTVEEYGRQERMKRSPRRADKVYVQKKNRFEATPRTSMNGNSVAILEERGDGFYRKFSEYKPIELASRVQRNWLPLTMLSHGFLGGLGLAHLVYLRTNYYSPDDDYLIHYASFSDIYVCLFYLFCVICLISVYDRYDLGNLTYGHLKEMIKTRRSSVVILVYFACMVVHLCAAKIDDKIGLLAYDNSSVVNITKDEVQEWSILSHWRSSLALLSWIIVGLAPGDDILYSNLKSMEQYIPKN